MPPTICKMKSIFLRSTPVTGISTCCCVTKGETTGEGEGEEGMTGEADPAGGTEEDELDEELVLIDVVVPTSVNAAPTLE